MEEASLSRPDSLERDWIGTWFVLAAKRGFQTEIVFGSPTVSARTPDEIHWRKFSHAEFDGVGLALNYFRGLGLNPAVPELPEKYRAPGFFAKLAGLIRNLRFVPVRGARWRRIDAKKIDDKSYGEYVHRILSVEETAALLKKAKANGVTANSHLLHTLDRVIRGEIIEGSGPYYWMVPVNMRGAVERPSDTCNQQSWVWVDTQTTHSASEIQEQIYTRFKENFHWGAWFVLNLGRFIGLRGMDWVLSQAENVKENWVGTFSNLGTWNVPCEPLVFVVPIGPTSPISVGCVTVNGRMALSLHVHPSVMVDNQELRGWLDRWIESAS